jgi:endonuclease/exonuclease/phosphatase family metal-dependent hydrolase
MANLKLKVLTVNAHMGFSFFNRRFILTELRDAVRHVGADIMFLQEVIGQHAIHAKRLHNWPDAPQYEYLADSIWTNYAYGRNAVYPAGDHGNALLSKFPIVRHENLDVSQRGDENRGLLHCVLDLVEARRELHVICVHLGLRETHRQAQLKLLGRRVLEQVPPDAPLIVAGDFNDWRLRAHQIMTHDGFREVFVTADGSVAKTFPARWPLLRLDRIYVRNAGSSRPHVLPRLPWSHLSDHAPLAAEIEI